MNRQLPVTITLPSPPTVPDDLPLSDKLRAWFREGVVRWSKDLVRALEQDLSGVHDQVNNAVQGVGGDIASGEIIAPDHAIHVVKGTAGIKTITAPLGFSGPVFLIAADTWMLVTGGNIAKAAAPVLNQVVMVVYNVRTSLWHPNF